ELMRGQRFSTEEDVNQAYKAGIATVTNNDMTASIDRLMQHRKECPIIGDGKLQSSPRKQYMQLVQDGELLCQQGKHEQGARVLESALLHADNHKLRSILYSQLGNIYFYLKKFDKALEYHQLDLELSRSILDKAGEAKASGNLGNALKALGRLDEAAVQFQLQLGLARETEDKLETATSLSGRKAPLKYSLYLPVTSEMSRAAPTRANCWLSDGRICCLDMRPRYPFWVYSRRVSVQPVLCKAAVVGQLDEGVHFRRPAHLHEPGEAAVEVEVPACPSPTSATSRPSILAPSLAQTTPSCSTEFLWPRASQTRFSSRARVADPHGGEVPVGDEGVQLGVHEQLAVGRTQRGVVWRAAQAEQLADSAEQEQRAGGAAPVPLHHPDARQRLPAGPDDALERGGGGSGQGPGGQGLAEAGPPEGGQVGGGGGRRQDDKGEQKPSVNGAVDGSRRGRQLDQAVRSARCAASFVELIHQLVAEDVAVASWCQDQVAQSHAHSSLGALLHAQAKHQGGPDLLPSSLSPAATSASASSLRCRFLAQSAEHYSQALALCRQLGDQRGVARACARLGSARHLLGEHRAAVDCHSERLAVAIATGDVETELLARRDLGNASVVLGDLAAAAEQFELCLQLARAAPDRTALEAQACWLLGNARTLLRDYPAAVANHERHLDIADRLGDKLGASQACLSLCNAFSSLGDYARAAHFAKRRQHLCEQLGDRAGAESAKLSLVDLRRLLRRPNDADVDYDDTSGPAPAAAQSSSRRASLGAAGHSGKDSRQRSGRPTAAAGKEAADNYNDDDDDDDDVDEVSRRQQAAFWDLVSRCQGRRMDDQRASPPLLPMEAAGAGVSQDESAEAFFDMLAKHQAARIDDQRASLPAQPPTATPTLPDSDAFASMARQSQEQRRQRGRTASLLSRLSLRRRAGRG
uniref:TPR_REGION domain-containing protein n=1 Tax=Macrostomum lignano TaxID=282301 RepID=A0A1I8HTZ9_9PLAT